MDKAGMATLFYRYAEPDSPDDTYVYIPITRRVHRTTNGGRGDVTWGTDIDTDSGEALTSGTVKSAREEFTDIN